MKLQHQHLLITVALYVIMAVTFTCCGSNEPDYHSEDSEIRASETEVEFEYKSNIIKYVRIYGDLIGYQVSADAEWLSKSYL